MLDANWTMGLIFHFSVSWIDHYPSSTVGSRCYQFIKCAAALTFPLTNESALKFLPVFVVHGSDRSHLWHIRLAILSRCRYEINLMSDAMHPHESHPPNIIFPRNLPSRDKHTSQVQIIPESNPWRVSWTPTNPSVILTVLLFPWPFLLGAGHNPGTRYRRLRHHSSPRPQEHRSPVAGSNPRHLPRNHHSIAGRQPPKEWKHRVPSTKFQRPISSFQLFVFGV